MKFSLEPTLSFTLALSLAGCGGPETTQPTVDVAVLVDLSPSTATVRSQQAEAIKQIVQRWKPYQTVDFIAVDGNPLGHAPLARMTAFLYDKAASNPRRYQLETQELRKKYLASIPAVIAAAMKDADDRNRNHPNLTETCLLDGFEAAARLFRRTPSQSREILALSDGYEDCSGSLHLPHEPLSPPRIEQVVNELEKRSRLPQFSAPTTARFIGTRLNPRSNRGYEDELEMFWISVLTRSGVKIRSEDFTPTLEGENRIVKAFRCVLVNFGEHLASGNVFPASPRNNSPPLNKGATMYVWPDNMPLLALNGAGDRLDLFHLFNTTHITGDMGSGKSSGTAAHLHMALLHAQCGGLLVCPKPTDYEDYMKQIRWAGREKDVILMRPTENWNDTPVNCLNVLDVELNRFGRGKVNVANVTALLMKVIDMIQRQTGSGGTNEAFFRNYAEKILKSALVAQSVVTGRIDLKNVLKFVNELPNTPAETEEDKLYSVALIKEARAVFGENAPFDFTLQYDFVMREWPLTPPNARGSGALTVSVMLNTLLSHPLRQMLFEGSSFDIDQVLSKQKILLLDMPIEEYAQGAVAGMILTDVIQRACEIRPELKQLEPQFVQPVFELIEEYPNYAMESHERHALMARGSRSIPIYISQSLPSVLGRFQDKDKAKSMLEVTGCRWAHQTGSSETAEWLSKCVGQVLVKRVTYQDGSNWNFGPQDTYGRNRGTSFTQQLEYECPPRVFTRLLRGGKANRLKTEAIYWCSGHKWRFNGRRYLPVCFPQDFRPGRDEVRVIARQKGGETNHVGSIAQEYLHRAAQAGRERLRSVFH